MQDGATVPLGSKNFLRLLTEQIPAGEKVTYGFRYRFEKVGQNMKPLKPYGFVKKTLHLLKDGSGHDFVIIETVLLGFLPCGAWCLAYSVTLVYAWLLVHG
jgi:hypothetical protein